MTCANCGGEGWVCENHPDHPWGDLPECPCGGAGMPCQVCNTAEIPFAPRGTVELWRADYAPPMPEAPS